MLSERAQLAPRSAWTASPVPAPTRLEDSPSGELWRNPAEAPTAIGDTRPEELAARTVTCCVRATVPVWTFVVAPLVTAREAATRSVSTLAVAAALGTIASG